MHAVVVPNRTPPWGGLQLPAFWQWTFNKDEGWGRKYDLRYELNMSIWCAHERLYSCSYVMTDHARGHVGSGEATRASLPP